jgi:hypothetical protein
LGKSTDSARGPDGMHLRSIGEVKRAIRVRPIPDRVLTGLSSPSFRAETHQEFDHHLSELGRVAWLAFVLRSSSSSLTRSPLSSARRWVTMRLEYLDSTPQE